MTSTPSYARQVLTVLAGAHQSVGTAESLTGGLLCATLVAEPGASSVVRGGIVAYAGDLKVDLLGVPADVIAQHGTVAAATARAMARQARSLLGADWGVAATGIAGPDGSEGQPAGTVHVAVAGPQQVVNRILDLPGDRDAVRAGTVRAALVLLLNEITPGDAPGYAG